MNLQLNDKRAIVTGASRGLGFAIARGLALEGCKVAINSREDKNITAAAKKISTECKVEIAPIAGDVSDPEFPEILKLP